MKRRIRRLLLKGLLLSSFILHPSSFSFAADAAKEVVVYCALDEPYAAPVLKSFEKKTGIKVKVIYDSEAVKTAGLVNRIIAEKERPVCDVFWNNEKLRTVLLARKGLLEKYEPAAWKERDIPHDTKNGLWSEFAARVRVVVYNPKYEAEMLEATAPTAKDNAAKRMVQMQFTELNASVKPGGALRGKVAIAHPLFGTTSTHFLDWMRRARERGEDPERWLQDFFATKPIICRGNSDVVRRVAAGEAYIGYTDSDDVLAAQARGERLEFFFPIFITSMPGRSRSAFEEALLIPNTVALIRGAPHRRQAEALADFLLSESTEIKLAKGVSRQIPLGRIEDESAKCFLPFTSGKHQLHVTEARRGNEEVLAGTLDADFELLRRALEER